MSSMYYDICGEIYEILLRVFGGQQKPQLCVEELIQKGMKF